MEATKQKNHLPLLEKDMKNDREIKKKIRELKNEMKSKGIRIVSFMNGGISNQERDYNCRLFQLKTELLTIEWREI